MVASSSLDLASPASLMRSLGLEPRPLQAAFFDFPPPMAIFAGGRGVGKSTAGLVLALHAALSRPAVRVLVVAPTARDAADLFGRMGDLVLAAGLDCEASRMRLAMDFPDGSAVRFVAATVGPELSRGLGVDMLVVDRVEVIPGDVRAALAVVARREGTRVAILTDPGVARPGSHP